MAREITEVWGVFNADGDLLGLGEIRTEAILTSDFGCDDDAENALYEGNNGPFNGFRVERLPLLTPHDAAVLEAAEAWVDAADHYPYGPKLEEAVRARRAANAGGEG